MCVIDCNHKNKKMQSIKQLLLPRARLFVPTEFNEAAMGRMREPQIYSKFGLRVDLVHPDDTKTQKAAKDLLWHNFYTAAPVTKCLRMYDKPTDAILEMVEKETDMYLKSGVSNVIRSIDGSSEVLGVGLSAFWKRNDDYDIIDCDAKTWHNTAAEIATELEPEDPRIVWRHYQFQHIYNLCQRYMKMYDLDHALWCGNFYNSKAIRASGINMSYFNAIHQEVMNLPAVMGTQINFKAYEKAVHGTFKNMLVGDSLYYSEEDLILDGQKAFDEYAKLGDKISFFIEIPEVALAKKQLNQAQKQ